MCIPKDKKSDYIYMINSSPEYLSWIKERFTTADEFIKSINELEYKKYQDSHRLANGFVEYEEFISDANKDIKIYELLSNICKDKDMRKKFIVSLKNVQEYDRKGYAYDERLLRKYSCTYYNDLNLYDNIMVKIERAQNLYMPPKYRLSIFDKCYQSYEFFEMSARIIAEKDTSMLEADMAMCGESNFEEKKEEVEYKLKHAKALSIMNEKYQNDINSTEEDIAKIEKEIGFNLRDYSEIITREIRYIKLAIVDMMTLGEKLRHSFSVDGDVDIGFDV